MTWPEEPLITTTYKPWPMLALAVLLFLVGLGYAYDGMTLASHVALALPVIVGFVTGTVVCLGLAWGLWQLHDWARIALVWLCILAIALTIRAVPLLLIVRPAGTMINMASLLPGALANIGAVVVLRYRGRDDTRRALKSRLEVSRRM